MRKINYIVLHCSASKAGKKLTVDDIDKMHRARGWRKIGYHYVIYPDGSIHQGRPLAEAGAHVAGQNADSVGICYIGGLDQNGKPADTRTEEQRAAMFFLLQRLKEQFPQAEILGHRDFSPDLDGNGVIEPWEFIKACPCFDARTEYQNV